MAYRINEHIPIRIKIKTLIPEDTRIRLATFKKTSYLSIPFRPCKKMTPKTISVLIFILIGICSFILYAILSHFYMQSFVTGEPSQDEALGWGYLGLLFISFILAILTGIIGGIISLRK